jgi:hypothetical protein
MPSANSANLMSDASEEQVLLGIDNALGQMPGGPDLADKGVGVQHIRDANGKITDVIVFFEDKVLPSDKAAALDKILNNNGVATVGPVDTTAFEDFDDEVAKVYRQKLAGAVIFQHETDFTTPGLQVNIDGTGAGGAVNNDSYGLIEIVNDKSASAPNSLKLAAQMDSAVGTTAFGTPQMRVEYDGLLSGWPTQGSPVRAASGKVSTCLPAMWGAVDTDNPAHLIFGIESHILNGAHFGWVSDAVVASGAPATKLEFELVGRWGFSGRTFWRVASGTLSDIDIPLDGAFHTIEYVMVEAGSVTPSRSMRWSIRVDGGTAVVVEVDPALVSPQQAQLANRKRWILHYRKVGAVPSITTAPLFEAWLDDLDYKFTLV